MPAPRPATQSLPFVIIFMPSGRMVGHVLFFPHPLQLIKGRAMVQAVFAVENRAQTQSNPRRICGG